MDEKQFKQLLKQLKIAENKSYDDIMELLDARLDEYLDRQDDASQEIVSQIHDAMDYAEEMQKEVGRGITIQESPDNEQEEEPDYESLKKDTHRESSGAKEINAAPDKQSSRNSTSATSGKLWFVSTTGAANVDNMFLQAEDDLKYEEWQHATDIFEMILQVEANNPSAYFGRALAENHLREPKQIGTALDKPLDNNVNLRRAFDHGNDLQKKYIQDALSERKNAIQYKDAERAYENARDVADCQSAAKMFTKISYYRDADDRSKQCLEKAKEITYKQAELLMDRSYKNDKGLDEAIDKFSTIEDYKDAKEKIRICRENKKEIVYWEAFQKLHDRKSVADIRVAAAKFAEIRGYKDAEELEEECRQLIPVMEGNNRKNEDVASFKRALYDVRRGNQKEYTSSLAQCEAICKKVKKIKESKSEEAQSYADVDLKKWNKDIREAKRERRAGIRSERSKNIVAVLLIVFTFLLGPICVNNFHTIELSGFMSYFPISYTLTNCEVWIKNPPAILFSFAPGNMELNISGAERLKYRIMPFVKLAKYHIGNTDVEELHIPETAKKISIWNASEIDNIDIPQGAIAVTIEKCPNVKQVVLPDTLKYGYLIIEEIGENARISFLDENGDEEGYMQGNCEIIYNNDPDKNSTRIYEFTGGSEAVLHNANYGEDGTVRINVRSGVRSVIITDIDMVEDINLNDATDLSYIEIKNCSNLQDITWPYNVDLSTVEIHMEGNPLLENAAEEAN